MFGLWKGEDSLRKKELLRCGLCDIEVVGTFEEHIKSEEHQSNLPKSPKPVKMPEVPVREVSETEKKENRDKVAHAENLGYYPVSNGRSYYKLKCECGEVVCVFCWRGCKRCPNCEKVLHLWLSFRETTS